MYLQEFKFNINYCTITYCSETNYHYDDDCLKVLLLVNVLGKISTVKSYVCIPFRLFLTKNFLSKNYNCIRHLGEQIYSLTRYVIIRRNQRNENSYLAEIHNKKLTFISFVKECILEQKKRKIKSPNSIGFDLRSRVCFWLKLDQMLMKLQVQCRYCLKGIHSG